MLPEFTKHIDIDYSLHVTESLIGFQTNEKLGFRTAGSAAEKEAAEFLYGEFKEIGLKNVRKEKAAVDTFTFHHAQLRYEDAEGCDTEITLSAFQTNCQAKNEAVEIIYLGKGTEADYEGIDVTGKVVLIDINMMDEWWITWPLYQAREKKARALIAANIDGYCSYSENTLGVQDVGAPSDLPTFSMTVADSTKLKEAIAANGSSIKAVLNADVQVETDGFTYNIIGEIPGEIDEVIYVIGHYDAYFKAFDDNSAGIGCMLGIVRALIKSGYQPKRTLRVIAHGAEEWGIQGTKHDWARGATVLTWNHPEWKENGFLLLNMDGNTLNSTATGVQVRTPYEMAAGIEKIGRSIEGCLLPFSTNSPLWTWTESYMYDVLGIPSIETFYEGVDFWGSYHSSSDLKEVNHYTDEAFRSSHILYGTFLQKFDALKIRPLNFGDTFRKFSESLEKCLNESECDIAEELKKAIASAIDASDRLAVKSVDDMDDDALMAFNRKISGIFALITNELFGIDWADNYDFIHVRNANNIHMLNQAIEALENGKIAEALDEHLIGIDSTWYGYHFSHTVCNQLADQLLGEDAPKTWATGKLNSIVDLWEPSRSLMAKRKERNADVSGELGALSKALSEQKEELSAALARELDLIRQLTAMMQELI